MTSILAGKKILVTGGTTREPIDGIRHYASLVKAGCLGHRAAALLAQSGAEVFLVSARNAYPAPTGVTALTKSLSTEDLYKTAQGVITERKIDICLDLANTPQFRAENPSHEKIRLKIGGRDEFEFSVTAIEHKLTVGTHAGFKKSKRDSRGNGDIVKTLWDIVDATEKTPALQTAFPLDLKPQKPVLAGYKIIVTAGATAEKISGQGDVITRHGSALQGYSVAASLAQMGADVTLISGRTSLVLPYKNVKIIKTESAFEMMAAIQSHLPADAFISCAAVTDFMAIDPLKKLRKVGETTKLYLSAVPDILETVGKLPAQSRPSVVIGFTAATEGLLQNAARKLSDKNTDALCALPADRDTKDIRFITADGAANWGDMSYADIGFRVGEKIAGLIKTKKTA